MPHIERHWRAGLEEEITGVAEGHLKSHWKYLQSKLALRNNVGGVENHQEIRSIGS